MVHTLSFKHVFFIGVWLSCPCPSDVHQGKLERHSVHYMFTALTKSDSFPEFTAVGMVDDRRISDYNNDVPGLLRRILIAEEEEIDAVLQSHNLKHWYKHQLHILSNCTQCSELHTFQRIIGCEVEKFPNGTVTSLMAFDEYGFDGEDLIAFDYDTMQWIVKSPKAKDTKTKWDHLIERNKYIKDCVEKCMDWIATFNNTQKNSPDVFISAKRAHDDHNKLVLTCLATGFYPSDIEMYIRLNESVLDNQMRSEIRPNANETFQINTSVEIDRNFKGSYDCFVIHSSWTEPLLVEWDGKSSTFETGSEWLVVVVVVVVVVVILVIVLLVVLALFVIRWPYINKNKRSNESFLALGRYFRGYGAVSQKKAMGDAACADASDQELNADGSIDQTEV
ncbi:hypothetical protein Q8A67_015966 [Cirrhinus molitorella]|uniref:Immunoglobulin C1-set domain-containing protein n=1 Tax=Cirrhinus molitorella TaxID=172907 RepID=A0AA88PFR8_9TELE|nr:hypothetical protein Q8A67_015966 [Cirrhinus molitorella]